MPTITDWLMVAITAVYVIATILICCANIKSANASKMQADEMKKQFDFSKRLECMPFLQLEISDSPLPSNNFGIELPMSKDKIVDSLCKILEIKNLGNGTATNIIYTWNFKDSNISLVDYPPINAIMSGDSYSFRTILDYEDIRNGAKGTLLFQYDDLLGNTYEQKATFCFEEYDLIRIENDTPNYFDNTECSDHVANDN